LSVYDIANAGKVVSGPAPRPPRKFEVKKVGAEYQVVSLEAGSIA
jgi:Rieske Fe-S protein